MGWRSSWGMAISSRKPHCIFDSPSRQAHIIGGSLPFRSIVDDSSSSALSTLNIRPHQNYEPVSIAHGIWNGGTHGHLYHLYEITVLGCEALFTMIEVTRLLHLTSNYRPH
jgi:hypothetical protein